MAAGNGNLIPRAARNVRVRHIRPAGLLLTRAEYAFSTLLEGVRCLDDETLTAAHRVIHDLERELTARGD